MVVFCLLCGGLFLWNSTGLQRGRGWEGSRGHVVVCFRGIAKAYNAAVASVLAFMMRGCVQLVDSCPTFLLSDNDAFWLQLNTKVTNHATTQQFSIV